MEDDTINSQKEDNSSADYVNINSPRDALAVLCLKVYHKFGDSALPLISDVCRNLGLALGKKMRKSLSEHDLASVGQAFVDAAVGRGSQVKVVSKSKDIFRFRTEDGFTCTFGLNHAGTKICKAIMAIDLGLFEAATGGCLKMKIIQSVAANARCCEVEYHNLI